MEQHTLETEPRILLRETNSADYTLSGTEALALGRALVKAGQLANATT